MGSHKDALAFLDLYTSQNTVKSYRIGIRQYLNCVYREGEVEEIADEYFRQARDYEEDVKKYFITFKDRPPKTVTLKIAVVKVFLTENKVDLPQSFWRSLKKKVKGNRAVTIDRVPSNIELRKILMNLPTNGRALFLTLASSGMRIGEALQLRPADVDLTSDPAKVKIQRAYTKTGNSRIAFISKEAVEAIGEWLKVRGEYIDRAIRRSTITTKQSDDRIFSFSTHTAREVWYHALNKARLNDKDSTTARYELHPHVLRKFFRTQLGTVIPIDIVEALMGHEGYLTEVYRKYSQEQLAEFYKQGEHVLSVFGTGDVKALENDVKDLTSKVTKREDLIDMLLQNGKTKEKQIEELSKQIEKIQLNLKASELTNTTMLRNVLERLLKSSPEDEALKALYDGMEKRLKESKDS